MDYMYEAIAKKVGNIVGEYVEMDANFFRGGRKYLKIKVKLNVMKPLKQSILFKNVRH